MVIRDITNMNDNSFTYHDMLSRIRFLATEIAVATDKLLNDLFIRESINNAIVDVYGRLYDKLKYKYISIAMLERDSDINEPSGVFTLGLNYTGTVPFKYGAITTDNRNIGKWVNEVVTLNMPNFSSVQFADMELFENIVNGFNATYKQSCLYVPYQNYIELYVGEKLLINYLATKPKLRMSYIRKPILDDLKKVHPDLRYQFTISGTDLSYFSETYNQPMDIPAEYNRLIEVMVMKDVYNGLGQPIPENYDNIITSVIQQMIGVQNVGSNSAVPVGA